MVPRYFEAVMRIGEQLCVGMLLLVGCCAQAWGQAESDFDTKPLLAVTEDYLFRIPGQAACTLRPQPIMVWSNPATFDQKGIVLVWMHQNRPQLVATVFQSTHPDGERIMFEGHSLATGPFEGIFKETRFWNIEKPGVVFNQMKDPSPAPVVSRRQLQMRQLAREFQVVLTNDGDKKETLRLLPTPVLTYEPNVDQCLDGAMFAFAATGTDPDAFLLIETIRKDNVLQYQFGFARFHFRDLVATRKSETVWHVETDLGMLNNFRGSTKYRSSVYSFFRTK